MKKLVYTLFLFVCLTLLVNLGIRLFSKKTNTYSSEGIKFNLLSGWSIKRSNYPGDKYLGFEISKPALQSILWVNLYTAKDLAPDKDYRHPRWLAKRVAALYNKPLNLWKTPSGQIIEDITRFYGNGELYDIFISATAPGVAMVVRGIVSTDIPVKDTRQLLLTMLSTLSINNQHPFSGLPLTTPITVRETHSGVNIHQHIIDGRNINIPNGWTLDDLFVSGGLSDFYNPKRPDIMAIQPIQYIDGNVIDATPTVTFKWAYSDKSFRVYKQYKEALLTRYKKDRLISTKKVDIFRLNSDEHFIRIINKNKVSTYTAVEWLYIGNSSAMSANTLITNSDEIKKLQPVVESVFLQLM